MQTPCGTGKITSGISPKASVDQIVDFIYAQLPKWKSDPARPVSTSECTMNLHLCKFLGSIARTEMPMVAFCIEEPQGGHRRVDLSVSPAFNDIYEAPRLTIYDPIMVIECKRLPAPENHREREYVTGGCGNHTGGIQRFKLGLHGDSYDVVAMIGYIEARSLSYWASAVNSWIEALSQGEYADDCHWSAAEQLVSTRQNSDSACLLLSNHFRAHSKTPFQIKHIWAVMF